MGNAGTGDAVFEELANAATIECVFASCFLPADTIAGIIPRGVGGPCALSEASSAWREGAEGLQQLQEQLRSLTEGLSEDAWAGDDRDGFDKEVQSLLAEIGDSHNTAEAIGIALAVLPPVFALWPTISFTLGSGMAVMAGSFYAAAATGVADITGVSEEIYAMGLEFSEMCLTVMNGMNGVLATVLTLVAGVIDGSVFIDIGAQQSHGNDQILGDLGQAEVDGLGEVAISAAQYGVSKGLERGAGHVGGETPDAPEFLQGAMGGLVRGEGHAARTGAAAVASQGDVAQHQLADLLHGGENLQSLINGLFDRKGPSVELEDEPDGKSDGESGG